jgi:Outer membrane lipoprotein-sorting protein
MNRSLIYVLLLCLPVVPCSDTLLGVSAASRGLEIMREVERRQRTDTRTHDAAIEVIDRQGKVLHKHWQFWGEGWHGESKVLIRFTAPPEVRGVGFLTVNHVSRAAEQWLYTPSIQRERRIAPQEKTARFMGTDFTHEDMEERSVEGYDYDVLGEESADGQPTIKLKGVYKDRHHTQYSSLVLHVRKDLMVTTAIEFYIDGKLRKTMLWSDWQPIQGVWTAHTIELRDLARGSATRLRVSDVKYNVTLAPDWFSLRTLRRAF